MDPLLFSILVVWAFMRYGVTDLISTARGTESPRQRDRAQRARQRHERQMARATNGHSGLTIGDAIAARIAARVEHPKEPRARGPAGRFFAAWWADAWNDAAHRRADRHRRARAGELPRQRAWRAARDRLRQRFTPTPDPEPVHAAADGPSESAGPNSGPSATSGPSSSRFAESAEPVDDEPPSTVRATAERTDRPDVVDVAITSAATAEAIDAEVVDSPPPGSGRVPQTGSNNRTDGRLSDWYARVDGDTCETCGGSGSEVDRNGQHIDACGPCRGFGKVQPGPQASVGQLAPPTEISDTTPEGASTMTSPTDTSVIGETIDPQAALSFAQGTASVAAALVAQIEQSIANLTSRGVSGPPIEQLQQMQESALAMASAATTAAGFFENHVNIQDVALSDDTLGGGQYVGIGS